MPVLLCRMLLPAILLAWATDGGGNNQPIALEGGSFAMGNQSGEADERPAHMVSMAPFSMFPYEVTNAQYDSCVDAGLCPPAHYGDGSCRAWNGRSFGKVVIPAALRSPDLPVVCVTWHQARQYCRSRGMQLPAEAQWEYAARGGSEGLYPWGDAPPSPGQAVISHGNGPRRVGSCPPNRRGLYDMTGNVWEWVYDIYAPDAYRNDSSGGAAAGFYRVVRGGGWYSSAAQATVANREWFSPDFGEVSIGFRCVTAK